MIKFLARLQAAQFLVAIFALALPAASCGNSDANSAEVDTTVADGSDDATTTEGPKSRTTDTAPTTEEDDRRMNDGQAMSDAEVVIKTVVADGGVEVESERIEIDLGSSVVVEIEADVTDHVHLHGYDVLTAVAPDYPAVFEFVADIPGVFEIELEESGTFLFEIVVSR